MVRRIGHVVLAGVVITTWMGLVEALLVCLWRDVPEPLLMLREAVLGYAALGAAVGAAWGAAVEALAPRHRPWRRRTFYLVSLFLLILLFQLVLHTHLHWTGGKLSPGSTRSLTVTAIMTLPVVVLLGGLWLACRRAPAAPARPVIRGGAAVLLLIAPAAAALLPWAAAALTPPRRTALPNVLLIVLDTTRVDRLSAFGYDRPTTPALERLAADGLVFHRAYSAAPWTLPSHASMFTGEFPTVHNANWEHQLLDDRLPTLAEHLAGSGMRTAAFSRQVWLSDETGLMRGFEHFYDLYWRSSTALVATWRLGVELYNVRRGTKDKGAAVVTEKFKGWIDRHGDDSFFAFINYVEPHDYYEPPVPFRQRFLTDANRDTSWGRTKNVSVQRYNSGAIEYGADDLSAFSDLYDGAVAYQDARMGEVIEHLRERDLLDETLVIVTADHGENLGEHGLLGHEFCLYETLVHVPLVVRLPDVVPAGHVTDQVVENRLIWSMIDAIFAAEGPVGPGRLVEAMQTPGEPGSAIFCELYRRPLTTDLWLKSPRLDLFSRRLRAIQLNRMKYIEASDGDRELYNLDKDPKELVDLTLVRPDDATVLAELLAARAATLGTAPAGEAPEFSEELKRRLKSLGYLD